MSALKNRSVAKLITAIVCVLALLIGSYRSINAEKNIALMYFDANGDPDAMSVRSDLNDKAAQVYATDGGACLYTLGLKLEADSDLLKTTSEVAQKLRQADTPAEAAKISQELTTFAHTLENNLMKNGISDSHKRELDGYISNIRAIDDILARSEYNARAAEANEKINGFPAGLFKSLMFIEDLEYFK
jgi:polyribonucleotide nucleotidyltransferase